MKGHAITGFNHGVLGLAELGPGFIHQNTSGDALGVFDSESQSLPSKHCDIGPTSTLTLGQRRHTDVGPTSICQLAQHGPNVGTLTLGQRWRNVTPMVVCQHCTNIGPTAFLIMECDLNGCMFGCVDQWNIS